MSLNRKERLSLSTRWPHAEAVSDGIISWILQLSKEAIGATLEGKNKALNWILEKTIPENLKTPKTSWLGKWWRFVSKHIIRRAVVTANNLVDTIGTAGISVIDVINNTQWEIHDIFTKQDTSQALTSVWYSVNDIVLKRLIKEALRKWLIQNRVGDTNFAGLTQRHYGTKTPITPTPYAPRRTPVPSRTPAPATP